MCVVDKKFGFVFDPSFIIFISIGGEVVSVIHCCNNL